VTAFFSHLKQYFTAPFASAFSDVVVYKSCGGGKKLQFSDGLFQFFLWRRADNWQFRGDFFTRDKKVKKSRLTCFSSTAALF